MSSLKPLNCKTTSKNYVILVFFYKEMLPCKCDYFKEFVDCYPKLLLTQYATVKTNAVQRAATKDIQVKQKAH